MSIVTLDTPITLPGPVVLFDGECVFCDWVVRFILDRERNPDLYFAPIQSEIAATLFREIPSDQIPDSVVFHDGARIYFKSDAALKVVPHLKAPWSWFAFGRILPLPIRDTLYGIIARSRYRIFGRKNVCSIPAALERARELTALPED